MAWREQPVLIEEPQPTLAGSGDGCNRHILAEDRIRLRRRHRGTGR
jgi:hypothetical protein